MSNIPENEKITKNDDAVTGYVQDEYDQYATVFGEPSDHNEKPKKKKGKNRLTAIIASILAVAVLTGGTIAVIKLIPVKEDEQPTVSGLETVKVLSLSSDDFSTVSVTNKNGVFKLYSEKSETDDTSSSSNTSSTTETVKWYVDGYEKDILNEASVSAIAKGAAAVEASRKIETKTPEECGLDNPSYKVDVTQNDGGTFSIYIGNDSPDNSGKYLKLSTDEAIYIVEDSVAQTFDFTELDLANTAAIPGITVTDDMKSFTGDDGALNSFTSITVSGKNFPETAVIEPNVDAGLSAYAPYMTSAPTKRIADKVDDLFKLFTAGVTATGAYSLDTSADSIKTIGLDNPDFEATIKIGDFNYTYKFKKMDDSSYAVLCSDSKMIKKVAASSLSFIDYSVNDFYASWVCLQSIDDLSNFTIDVGGTAHSFDIQKNADDADDKYEINYNGTKITTQYFQNFYQYCIGLSCNDYTVEALNAAPDMTFKFTYSDTSKGTGTVTFTKCSETKYQYAVDGVDMGKITSASYNKIIKYIDKIIQNQDVN